MSAFVIRRLLQAVLVIFLVVTLVFFLIRVSGDPASLGVNLDPNRSSEEIDAEYQEIRRKMGLDKHPIVQYFVFWQRTLQLDFGYSFRYGVPTTLVIFERLPNSLRLGAAAGVLGIALGLPLGIVGGILLLGFAFMAIFGPAVAPNDPVAIDLANPFAKPVWLDLENGTGLMGTDNLGRDVFSRVLVGSRLSLLVGSTATVIGLVIGIVMGLISGYRGGLAGDIIMRVADTQTAIPFLVLLIAAVAFVGGGLLNIILFLGIGAWVGYARLIRGEVLSIRERDFVEAARALGAGDTRIMFRHILPNAVAPVIVTATLSFGSMILTESALSFLGFGVSTLIPT